MSWLQKVSMSLCVLFGFAYCGWLAVSEGGRFFLPAGLIAVVGGVGLLVHRLMAVRREK